MRCQARASDCVLRPWYFETPPYKLRAPAAPSVQQNSSTTRSVSLCGRGYEHDGILRLGEGEWQFWLVALVVVRMVESG